MKKTDELKLKCLGIVLMEISSVFAGYFKLYHSTLNFPYCCLLGASWFRVFDVLLLPTFQLWG